MKQDDFINGLYVALSCKTLYVKGGFGLTLTASGKKRAIASYDYNKKRADKINAMPSDSFGFDCCGLIKGVIGGFTGNKNKVYGGAVYNKDNTLGADRIPDYDETRLFNTCNNITKCKKVDMPSIPVGAMLWMTGHCGVYVGEGWVIESTPAWADGVQKTRYVNRNWMKWGLLPYVEYEGSAKPIKIIPPLAKPTLRNGSKGMQTYYLQQDLNYLGEKLSEDGDFGPKTAQAVKNFQKKYKLSVDGIYGPKSYNKMREVLK